MDFWNWLGTLKEGQSIFVGCLLTPLIALIAFILKKCFSGQPKPKISKKEFLKQGREIRNLEEKIAKISKSLQKTSQNIDIKKEKVASGKEEKSLKEAIKALANSPEKEKQKAFEEFGRGEIEEGIKTLEGLQKKRSKHAKGFIETNMEIAALLFFNDPDKSMCLFKEVIDIDPNHLDALSGYSIMLLQKGKSEEAIEHIERALLIAKDTENIEEQGKLHLHMGIAYKNLKQYEDAIESYKTALKFYGRINDYIESLRGMARTLSNTGIVYRRQAESEKDKLFSQLGAMEEMQAFGEAVLRKGNSKDLSLKNTYKNLIKKYGKGVHLYPKLLEGAIGCHEDALLLFVQIKDSYGISANLCSLGTIHHILGRYDEAIEYYKKSLRISHKLKNLLGKGSVLGELGITYSEGIETRGKAIKHFKAGIRFLKEINSPYAFAVELNLNTFLNKEKIY